MEADKCVEMAESRFIKFSAPVCTEMVENNRKTCGEDDTKCIEKDLKMTEECAYHR